MKFQEATERSPAIAADIVLGCWYCRSASLLGFVKDGAYGEFGLKKIHFALLREVQISAARTRRVVHVPPAGDLHE